MNVSRANVADFVYFLAIARHQSFNRAGKEGGHQSLRLEPRNEEGET